MNKIWHLSISISAILCLLVGNVAFAQDSVSTGTITALKVDGDRLLIGQGDMLVEVRITDDDLQVVRRISLQRHELRAFAVYQGITLALSEDGLTTLNREGKILDFAQGGGQRLAVSGGRVYIAALRAGVRLLQLDSAGKLTALGTLPTAGVALDLAPEANGLVWVAEGDQGIRLYDSTNRRVVTWINNLVPAQVVRLNGARLLVGYGSSLALLDTINPTASQVLGNLSLNDGTVTDLLVSGNQVYAGRQGASGADVVLLNIEDGLHIQSQLGTSGTGERIALRGSDLFIGSVTDGLRRVRFGESDPVLIKAWPAQPAAGICVLTAPSVPQPANNSEVMTGEVTLRWSSTCSPSAYELRVNGAVVTTLNKASHTFTPETDVIDWQVTAIDAEGNRVDSPLWHFERAVEGWLATPAAPPDPQLLYVPPPIQVQVDMNSPQTVLTLVCGTLVGGIGFIVGVAWLLGRRFDSPFPKL